MVRANLDGMRCWINTVSLDHVLLGVEGGFTQAGHGKSTGLRRLARGDRIAFYSPRTSYPDGDRLQQLTAIGTIDDDEAVQHGGDGGMHSVGDPVHPWRRVVRFATDVHAVDIRGLLPELSFITDERRWGYPFRRGLFEVPCADLDVIEHAMRA